MPDMKFEEAMSKLEGITTALENGDLGLDEALKKYEEGIALTRICQKKLEEAKKRIEVLVRSKDGTLTPAPFDPDNGAVKDGAAKPKKRGKKADNEELF